MYKNLTIYTNLEGSLGKTEHDEKNCIYIYDLYGYFRLFLHGAGEDKFSATYVKAHIVENKTTKAEVQALYGVPDDQSTSATSTSWYYTKGGNISSLSTLSGYIPGAGAVTGALGMASSAQRSSDDVTKASNKLSGNAEHRDGSLRFSFNERDVVTSWHLY